MPTMPDRYMDITKRRSAKRAAKWRAQGRSTAADKLEKIVQDMDPIHIMRSQKKSGNYVDNTDRSVKKKIKGKTKLSEADKKKLDHASESLDRLRAFDPLRLGQAPKSVSPYGIGVDHQGVPDALAGPLREGMTPPASTEQPDSLTEITNQILEKMYPRVDTLPGEGSVLTELPEGAGSVLDPSKYGTPQEGAQSLGETEVTPEDAILGEGVTNKGAMMDPLGAGSSAKSTVSSSPAPLSEDETPKDDDEGWDWGTILAGATPLLVGLLEGDIGAGVDVAGQALWDLDQKALESRKSAAESAFKNWATMRGLDIKDEANRIRAMEAYAKIQNLKHKAKEGNLKPKDLLSFRRFTMTSNKEAASARASLTGLGELSSLISRRGGGADISYLYKYVRTIDPASAVREFEANFGFMAGTLPDKIKAAITMVGAGDISEKEFSKIMSEWPEGKRRLLSREVKANILASMIDVGHRNLNTLQGAYSDYNNIAKEANAAKAYYLSVGKERKTLAMAMKKYHEYTGKPWSPGKDRIPPKVEKQELPNLKPGDTVIIDGKRIPFRR